MFFIFADASYYKKRVLSVASYFIHDSNTNQRIFDSKCFTCKNSFHAELIGVTNALEMVNVTYRYSEVKMFVDNQATIFIMEQIWRDGESAMPIINKRQNNKYIDTNVRLYAALLKLADMDCRLSIFHVKSHKEKMNKINTPLLKTIDGIMSMTNKIFEYTSNNPLFGIYGDPIFQPLSNPVNQAEYDASLGIYYHLVVSEYNALVDKLSYETAIRL